jgi:AmmeMemoRadiSam system protein B
MRVSKGFVLPACLAIAAVFATAAEDARPPSRKDVSKGMGLASRGNKVRGQKDTVGFVVTSEQAEDVIRKAIEDEAADLKEQDRKLEMDATSGFLGGISPHDDHLYAARVYVHLTERITAPRVILIGVFHKARLWDLENKLVFDDFNAWHGPWGPVDVDPLRGELLEELPQEVVVVDNSMHEMEHSLEAIVPFLQHKNRDVTIVPILAPYMDWDQVSTLSEHLADALSSTMKANGWQLGKDVAIVISSDAVHYGDDFDHVPYGTNAQAYLRAVEWDRRLNVTHLTGPLDPNQLEELLYKLVDHRDVRRYRVPWCGRFSIPFGLEVLRKTAAELGNPVPTGHLLRYGTSLSEAEVPASEATREAGLGYTAPSNLHHWVGYAAVGYR